MAVTVATIFAATCAAVSDLATAVWTFNVLASTAFNVNETTPALPAGPTFMTMACGFCARARPVTRNPATRKRLQGIRFIDLLDFSARPMWPGSLSGGRYPPESLRCLMVFDLETVQAIG